MKQQVINMATINCHAQTKMTLVKQLQIDQLLAQYDLDILLCQETAIIDGTFRECQNVMNNYKIIYNNAGNNYGTSILIKNSIEVSEISMDTQGRIIRIDTGNSTILDV